MKNGKLHIVKVVKVFICFSLFIFHYSRCSAQHGKSDSLIALLKTDKEDTTKLNHLSILAQAVYTNAPRHNHFPGNGSRCPCNKTRSFA